MQQDRTLLSFQNPLRSRPLLSISPTPQAHSGSLLLHSPTIRSVSPGNGGAHLFPSRDTPKMPYLNETSDELIRKMIPQTLKSPADLHWDCHSIFDMIHPSGCSICRSYMDHVVSSKSQPSFQNALKIRDRQRDTYFFDGVNEGRRLQRGDDEYILEDRERYRNERNNALEAISQYRIESHDSREELRMVTEHFRASQAECDRLRQCVEALNLEKLDLANQLKIMSSSGNFSDHEYSQPAESSPPQQTIKGAPPIIAPVLRSEIPEMPRAPNAPISYAAVASSQPANPSSSSIIFTTSANIHRVAHTPVRTSESIASPQAVDMKPSTSQAAPNVPSPRSPRTIRQLQALIETAHKPGNDAALAKIKTLCTEAHLTPRELKTDMQRYLLSNWRNPSSNGDTPPSKSPIALPPTPPQFQPTRPGGPSIHPKPNPRMDDPAEVWYDYLCAHSSSWPRGVRRDSRNRPKMSDLKASRTVARLRPEIDPSGSITPRSEFMACVADLFSKPGAYQGLVEASKFRIAPTVSFRPYRGPTPVTSEDVARHFADSGVTFIAAAHELEPWAQSYQASVVGS